LNHGSCSGGLIHTEKKNKKKNFIGLFDVRDENIGTPISLSHTNPNPLNPPNIKGHHLHLDVLKKYKYT